MSSMRCLGLFLFAMALVGCRGILPSSDPTPSSIPTAPNSTARPSSELNIVRDGFDPSSLSEEHLAVLAELEAAYREAVGAQTRLRGATLIETVGAQGPGAYLQDEGGNHWVLYRSPANTVGRLQQVPDVQGSRRGWDADNNRFIYLDGEGQPVRAYVPRLDAVLPLVGGLVWSGFTQEQLELAQEALGWLGQVAPQRLEFLHRMGIPIVLFRGRDEVLAGLVDRRGIVLYRDAFALEGAPAEINRLWLLSVLYHEAIHVRQSFTATSPGTACERESQAVAEEIGLMQELRAFLSPPYRPWVEVLIHGAEQYAAVSCGLATPTPISLEPGPLDSYLPQVEPIYRGWGAVMEEWNVWLEGLSRYQRDGYALEGWWDHFCGQGWYYQRVSVLHQQLTAVVPPAQAQEFHTAFQDLLEAHWEEEAAKEEFCANADPTPGYMGNTDLWKEWVQAVERNSLLTGEVSDLYGRLLS